MDCANASVIGKIKLEREVGVWFGAVLRGDVELIHVGEGSNIQDNAILHTDAGFPLKIGRCCTIGHKAMLHGCTVNDNTLIGVGATVLNGAKIGSNCIIGAHALVTEKKIIPDNCLVIGTPAKVVRELSTQEIEDNTRAAGNYIENWKRFSVGIVRVD